MNGYYSVKEFAELTGVEASKLRYWDEMGVFSPIKREDGNQYRQYSLAQLTALNFVSVLSDLNIPLKVIARLREKRDPESLVRLLEKRERRLDLELQDLRRRSSVIHARRELIHYGLTGAGGEISVRRRDDKELRLWPRSEYGEGDTFIDMLAAVVPRAKDLGIDLDFPVGGLWDSMEAFQKEPARPGHFFSVDPTGRHMRKKGEYLVGFTRGEYGEMGGLPGKMAARAKEQGLALSGPVYVMYLHDEICESDPSEYLAQACVAVSK